MITEKQSYSWKVCVVCFIALFIVGVLTVIFPVDISFPHSKDGNRDMDVPSITVVRDLQIYLNSLDDPRYDCGVVDGEAGGKFCVAINNWTDDRYYKESIKAMVGK